MTTRYDTRYGDRYDDRYGDGYDDRYDDKVYKYKGMRTHKNTTGSPPLGDPGPCRGLVGCVGHTFFLFS